MAVWFLRSEGPDTTYTVTLEGQVYDIRFRWNERDQSWKCFIGITGETFSASFKMTNGFDLLEPYKYMDGIPKGNLYILDVVNIWGRPDYDHTSQDGDFRVTYVDSTTTATELAA